MKSQLAAVGIKTEVDEKGSLKLSAQTEDNLINKNIKYYEFNKNNITGDHYYIIGNAYNYNNIEVKEIPYSETSNEYGYTITIA